MHKLKAPQNANRTWRTDQGEHFFEFAVASAITRFGLVSGAGLACVIGVLVEAPIVHSVYMTYKASLSPWPQLTRGLPRFRSRRALADRTRLKIRGISKEFLRGQAVTC